MGDLITREPKSPCRPHLWRYEAIRRHMMEAGRLITAKEAERRVLILENPGLRGQSKITTSLYAGVQMVVPGEVAPAHRHSQSALRFILEGKGAHTAVDGERTAMAPGDFVITPARAWHDHGNETSEPMLWLDGLDIPMVQLFDASFVEGHKDDEQPITRPAGDSFARYGHNLLPVDFKPKSKASPVFNYPYESTRGADTAKRASEWDPCHGLKPLTPIPSSANPMPTIGTFIQLLPKDFRTARYRALTPPCHGRRGARTVANRRNGFGVGSARHFRGTELALQRTRPMRRRWFSFSDRPVQKLDLFLRRPRQRLSPATDQPARRRARSHSVWRRSPRPDVPRRSNCHAPRSVRGADWRHKTSYCQGLARRLTKWRET